MTLIRLPPFHVFEAAMNANTLLGQRCADPTKCRVGITAQLTNEATRLMTLDVDEARLPTHSLAPIMRAHEFAVRGTINHPFIKLKLLIIVDSNTSVGVIRDCHPASGQIDPWPFLQPIPPE